MRDCDEFGLTPQDYLDEAEARLYWAGHGVDTSAMPREEVLYWTGKVYFHGKNAIKALRILQGD